MHRDGRFNPLELLGEVLALVAVLITALVAWVRHDPATEAPTPTFREVRDVTGPSHWKP